MKCYRLHGSAAQIAELARLVLGICAPISGHYEESHKHELRLIWRKSGSNHILELGTCRGLAMLTHEWGERKPPGVWCRCCETQPVQIDTLLRLGMLQAVEGQVWEHR